MHRTDDGLCRSVPFERLRPRGQDEDEFLRQLKEQENTINSMSKANRALRREQGLVGRPVDVHEIKPVKFGGSPTHSANKAILPRDVHRQQVTPWWNQLQKDLGK